MLTAKKLAHIEQQERDLNLQRRDPEVKRKLIDRKDRDIAGRNAKLEKITFEFACLERWKGGAMRNKPASKAAAKIAAKPHGPHELIRRITSGPGLQRSLDGDFHWPGGWGVDHHDVANGQPLPLRLANAGR